MPQLRRHAMSELRLLEQARDVLVEGHAGRGGGPAGRGRSGAPGHNAEQDDEEPEPHAGILEPGVRAGKPAGRDSVSGLGRPGGPCDGAQGNPINARPAKSRRVLQLSGFFAERRSGQTWSR
jgi:hypothetical protein